LAARVDAGAFHRTDVVVIVAECRLVRYGAEQIVGRERREPVS
jgi:hypothetical protein